MRDVRMVERGCGSCFLSKAAHPILIAREFGRQNLQRDFSIELHILRQIHFAHSTRADLRADFIAAQSSANGNQCAYSPPFLCPGCPPEEMLYFEPSSTDKAAIVAELGLTC